MFATVVTSEVNSYKLMSKIMALEEEFHFNNAEQNLSYIKEVAKADLLILDIDYLDPTCIDEVVRYTSPRLGYIVFGIAMEGARILQLLRQGVCGFISIGVGYDRFVAELTAFQRCGSVMSPTFVRNLSRVMSVSDNLMLNNMPLKRAIVARALLADKTYKEIAAANGVSVETVRDHVKQIYRHFQVHSRVELKNKVGYTYHF